MMAPVFAQVAADLSTRFVFAKVNTEQEQQIAALRHPQYSQPRSVQGRPRSRPNGGRHGRDRPEALAGAALGCPA
jgi:hypothetical protein